jgi:uncharacterized protein with NRDE domain
MIGRYYRVALAQLPNPMCLITIAHRCHRNYPLLVAANRDEYYRRRTAAAHFWAEAPGLLAGRDLEAGGTWMGLTASGRFAALTNHRNPPSTPTTPRSRGLLVSDYLSGDAPAIEYLESVAGNAGDYAGFNLLLSDPDGIYYFSNIECRIRELAPGIYSLSNGLLDANWPKQRRASEALGALTPDTIDHGDLQATISSRSPARDSELPETGIGIEMERVLSAQFIVSPDYGTRATTTLTVHRSGHVEFHEQSFGQGGATTGKRRFTFRLIS